MGFWDRFEGGRAGRWPEGPGGEALSALRAGGLVEPAWSLPHPGGLSWWPSAFETRIGVTADRTLEGLRVSRVLVETDVADGLPESADALRRLDLLNQRASLSALTRDESGGLVLAASFVVHEKNVAWTRRMLPAAVALQAAEAPVLAAALEPVGAAPAVSAHPVSGPRPREQAQLGGLASQVLAHGGAGPLDPRIFEDIAATLRDVGLTARADRRGLDVEVPFAGENAMLQMLGPLAHPGIGDGVLVLLVLPVLALRHPLEAEGTGAFLARLNAQARSVVFHAESLPALGGWAPDPNSGHPALAAFVPALLAHDEVLTDLAMAQLARALLLARAFDASVSDPGSFARGLAEAI